MYSIRRYDPAKTFAPDEHRESPQEAVTLALSLSAEHAASVSSDARNWADFQGGNMIARREWEDFYDGEPSEEYKALQPVLDQYKVVKTAKIVSVTDGSERGSTYKRVLYRCTPPLFRDHDYVLASATTNHGNPETMLFASDAAGTWGREVTFGSRRVFDPEAVLKEEGYTCSA